jgi:hypothetical protein
LSPERQRLVTPFQLYILSVLTPPLGHFIKYTDLTAINSILPYNSHYFFVALIRLHESSNTFRSLFPNSHTHVYITTFITFNIIPISLKLFTFIFYIFIFLSKTQLHFLTLFYNIISSKLYHFYKTFFSSLLHFHKKL